MPSGLFFKPRPVADPVNKSRKETKTADGIHLPAGILVLTLCCGGYMTEIFRAVAERVVFIGEGRIAEENTSASFFENPQHECSKDFLGQILQH